jgi:hypothetical protein
LSDCGGYRGTILYNIPHAKADEKYERRYQHGPQRCIGFVVNTANPSAALSLASQRYDGDKRDDHSHDHEGHDASRLRLFPFDHTSRNNAAARVARDEPACELCVRQKEPVGKSAGRSKSAILTHRCCC